MKPAPPAIKTFLPVKSIVRSIRSPVTKTTIRPSISRDCVKLLYCVTEPESLPVREMPTPARAKASPAVPEGVTSAGRPVRVGLVQINNSFSGQNYLPYSVALLQTYVQKMAPDPARYEFLPALYKRVR